ncbi:MAG: hypothetical protein KF729_25880 [Sandaracinaceae bacterium]|nr:hypothetical protein [Sandaracinaceae bacterium]
MRNLLTILLSFAVLGCGGGQDLSPDGVRSIPPGDASGAALAGEYRVRVRVVECAGACGPFSVGIFSSTVCDVGDVDEVSLLVAHDGGRLAIDTDDLPSRFEGGAFTDGSFDVGGYATQFGGGLEITARSLGTIDASGRIEATVRSRTWGRIGEQSADCYGVREVVGTRR